VSFDRRQFLGSTVFTLAGVAAGAALPVSLLQASPACLRGDPCGDWTLDDICGAYPPYAFRRDADHPRTAALPAFQVDPLDALFAV
jgi:hypothetical protein